MSYISPQRLLGTVDHHASLDQVFSSEALDVDDQPSMILILG